MMITIIIMFVHSYCCSFFLFYIIKSCRFILNDTIELNEKKMNIIKSNLLETSLATMSTKNRPKTIEANKKTMTIEREH